VLIQALRKKPHLSATLDLYGIVQGEIGQKYLEWLRKLANGDSRISFCNPVPSNQVILLLSTYDVLAVPSQCLETGPLVVLEAYAAGIPVLGSNTAGIAELVDHEVNGLLVEPDSIGAWHQAIQRVLEDNRLLMKLRAGVRIPREMHEVSEEMVKIYR
jgi:glycosyltransferase involved in cell wall biosynthesis